MLEIREAWGFGLDSQRVYVKIRLDYGLDGSRISRPHSNAWSHNAELRSRISIASDLTNDIPLNSVDR